MSLRSLFDFDLEKHEHKTIYDAIVQYFAKQNIRYCENLIGFVADGAGVMFGKSNAVYQLLKKDTPDLFAIITSACHSFAIVASNGRKELPSFVEDALRDICSSGEGQYQVDAIIKAPALRIIM